MGPDAYRANPAVEMAGRRHALRRAAHCGQARHHGSAMLPGQVTLAGLGQYLPVLSAQHGQMHRQDYPGVNAPVAGTD
jgi:hypothetical protein